MNKPLLTIAGVAASFLVTAALTEASAQVQTDQQPSGAQGAQINVQQPQPKVTVQQPAPQVQVQQPAPKVSVEQPQPQVTVQQPQPKVTVQQPQPQITVQQPKPEVMVQQPPPQVTVQQPKPEVTVQQAKPEVRVEQQGQPQVTIQEQGQPQVTVQEQGKPQVNVQSGGAAAQSQGQQTQAALAAPPAGFRSTKLAGSDLYNAQGQKIGEVQDFIIRKDGTVSQAILNVNDRRIAVPLHSLRLAENDRVIYQGDPQQLQQLPEYRAEQTSPSDRVPPIVGRSVRNAQNETIGEVDDLIISPDARVSVVLSVGGFLGVGDRLVVVPFDSVQLTGGDYLLYEGSRQQLAQLPEFNYDQLQHGMGAVSQPSTEEQRQQGTVR